MLVRSHRHTERDIERWHLDERRDAINARRLPLEKMADEAVDHLEAFAADGWCWAGTSWGKDSTVLAHLCSRLKVERGVTIPVWWNRIEPNSNPDSPLVRDAFLAEHPLDYAESEAHCDVARLRDLDTRSAEYARAYDEATEAAIGTTYWKSRHVSGIRAAESQIRRMRSRLGVRTRNACAPLLKWSTEAVFAYLYRYGLPVHPAYACTGGGMWERDLLRVTALGGEEGNQHGREEWERRYYGPERERVMGPARC